MTDTINLRQARKARERLKNRAQADENAAKHGRTKAQRKDDEARVEAARAHLDGHLRERE